MDTNIDDAAAARSFIDWIYTLNREFGIPTSFAEIQEVDIPAMAAHADKECNPLYPVPVLMDRKGPDAVYRQLTEEHHGN